MRPLLVLAGLLVARQASAAPFDHFVLDGEAGPLYLAVNDGNYGPDGTLYRASDVGQTHNLVVAKRLSAEAWFGRHGVVLLYAPLDVTTEVVLQRTIQFRGQTFASGTLVDHRYLFDGYRASYLYGLVRGDRWALDLGGSLQIRNADVAFTAVNEGRRADVYNIGPVPALKLRATYSLPSGVYGMFETDALSSFGLGTKGSLVDAALSLGAPVADGLGAFVRLRVLEGGASVPDQQLYNHAWFFSATAGVRADVVGLFAP